MEDIINMIKEALQAELENDGLTELPQDFYGIAALRIKQLRLYELTGVSDDVKEAAKGLRELLVSMIFDLIDLRAKKMLDECLKRGIPQTDVYERPLAEALARFLKEVDLLKGAVLEGNVKDLQDRYRSYRSGYRLVRFNAGIDRFVGIDLVEYGPFEQGDVVVMPFENAKTLIEKKIVEDLGGVQ